MNTATITVSNRMLNLLIQIGTQSSQQIDVDGEQTKIYVTDKPAELKSKLDLIKDHILKRKAKETEGKNQMYYSEVIKEIEDHLQTIQRVSQN
jgi:hypothetical protein